MTILKRCLAGLVLALLLFASPADSRWLGAVTTPAGGGASPPLLIDLTAQFPNTSVQSFNLGLLATVSNGASLTYKVQVTGDQVPLPNGNWNDHDAMSPTNPSWAGTASANGNVGFPITGVRVITTAWASGTVSLTVTTWP